jgi:glycogen debranching enzyme
MSTADAAFNPIGYHTGTVWPHDTSLGAWGLARAGHWAGVGQIAEAVLSAAAHFDWSLPEVFAGFSRSSTPFPVAYPTAASPQAWAAGAPVLLLRLLLGLEPDAESGLRSVCGDPLPEWLGRVRLTGVRARGRSWDVTGEGEEITVTES